MPALQKIDDALWTALLLALIWLANRHSDVEIAGAAPTAFLLAVRFWRDERPDGARLRAALRAAAPYVALTLALCATRLVHAAARPAEAARGRCGRSTTSRPSRRFYAPGFWLLSIGIVVVLVAARTARPRSRQEALNGAWRACAVTLAFVVMAEFYVGSGMATSIAEALRSAAGRGAALGVPLFAGGRRLPDRQRLRRPTPC